jgi:hypothetical protein
MRGVQWLSANSVKAFSGKRKSIGGTRERKSSGRTGKMTGIDRGRLKNIRGAVSDHGGSAWLLLR